MTKGTLEITRSIDLLGYTIEVYPIEQFKLFYNQCNSFNSFSEKAFLKAVKIPPQYFLEQPEETREELLDNKEELIPKTKLAGKSLVILKKGSEVLNCIRIDYNELQDLYERITLEEDTLKKLIPVKDFIKEGYSSNFIPQGKLEEGKYNLGVYIDIPLLLNKEPVVNIGFYYLPKKGEDNYKNLYVDNIKVDFSDYQTLELLLEDILKINIKEIEDQKIIDSLKDKQLLREIDDLLLQLKKGKVIPKSYVNKISKFIYKSQIQITSVFSFIELILSYEANFKAYKQVNKIRSCKDFILNLTKTTKESDEEISNGS